MSCRTSRSPASSPATLRHIRILSREAKQNDEDRSWKRRNVENNAEAGIYLHERQRAQSERDRESERASERERERGREGGREGGGEGKRMKEGRKEGRKEDI